MNSKLVQFFLGVVVVMVVAVIAAFAQQPNNKQNNLIKQSSTKINTQNIQHGYGFVDKNGDGYNDNAPDHDGDGIPNGLDSDYQGAKKRRGNQTQKFVDNNGDGINDAIGHRNGFRGRGGRTGISNKSRQSYGTNVCDGTGPKGAGMKRSGK